MTETQEKRLIHSHLRINELINVCDEREDLTQGALQLSK